MSAGSQTAISERNRSIGNEVRLLIARSRHHSHPPESAPGEDAAAKLPYEELCRTRLGCANHTRARVGSLRTSVARRVRSLCMVTCGCGARRGCQQRLL